MGDTGIILNITDSSARAPYRRAGTWQQSKGVKRKFSNVSKEPEAKRQPAPPSQKYQSKNKLAERNKGKNSPSKKTTSVASEENQKGRPAVKTSSLFKNNPEVPAIERTKITQLQEQVFSSDSFSELELHPHLVSTITNVLNMTHMTSVQKRTIPVLMSGRDALVRSQTGSGKTLAYGIPLVQALQGVTPKIQRIDGPYALIIVPTRELALQSFTTIQKLLKPFTWIVPGVLMGGEKRKSEKARLRKGINILISTPGRLVDHIKSTQSIHFTRVRWLIVDEADRILDLGFEKDVTAILNALNAQCQERQNVLLSATLSQGVTRLADVSLHNPLSITITDDSQTEAQRAVTDLLEPSQQSDGETSSFAMPEKLRQHAVVVPSKLKLVTLAAFILAKWKCEKKTKMIIFFPSCELVEFHHKLLSSILELIDKEMQTHSKAFFRLHGNMEQEERTEVFQQFTQARAGVLFCTDVAARGLDLPQVTWIVQYNAPASAAEYIHRVGRTARLGAQGSSLLILLPSEAEYIRILADHKISVSEMKMDEVLSNLLKMDFLEIKRVGIKKSQASDPQAVRERATVLQTKFEDYVHRSPDTALCAKRALQSYVRSYATYPKTLKHIFHVRSLHLGHVAKSFGLRDAPHNLSQQLAGNPKHLGKAGPRRANVHKKMKAKQKFSDLLLSEFSSGFSPKPKKAKHDTNQKIET
ncbi:probable ATP-dependent RNA helicase DDX31 [Bombina bombina]|uniref:probable ATP-dependent RNA helicase DDX31 n=1 Tax=Bombina bombina TaxID=8345 RepID=UPI00235AF754|nr:probable ATP-dependent RNA helicase DDX31 [Bombina bombina]